MFDRVNILMLGGAKRVSIGRMFIEAARRLGLTANLYSYELDRHVPIACIAEVIAGVRWDDEKLVESLNTLIASKEIDIVLPFVDGALAVCASGKLDAWSPTSPNATSFDDKLEAEKLFVQAGIPIPGRFDPFMPKFPLIAKPRRGSASRGIKLIEKLDDLLALKNGGDYHLQQYITNAKEYTVDCYVTCAGDIKCSVVRRRLEVSGGEVTRTVTVDNEEIVNLSRQVLSRLNLTGAVTLQFIEGEDKQVKLMEINPRLGGGAVCAIHAGADIPAMILAEYFKLDVPACDNPRTGTLITRYQQEVVFYE